MSKNFHIHTYAEIVFSVGNLAQTNALYTDYLGFEQVNQSAGDRAQMDFWQLPESAETEEILLQFKGLPYGQIRLMKFSGVAQQMIRPGGQTWDTGGILDIDLRTSDLDKTFEDLLDRGWHGYSEPVLQTMGPFTLREVLLKGHDGVVIAFINRIEPPHPNPFQLEGITSNVYLTAMIVRELEAASHFFVEQLGFHLHNQIDFTSPEPGPSMFGLPHNLSDQVKVKLHIIGPEENRDGLMDLVALEGATGRDFSAQACPPNRGILMYRFPVDKLENYYEFVQQNGVKPVRPMGQFELAPYGRVRIFAVQSPDGVWIEFFEKI
jgi:catechol 2,3-dioxygenase-like lactoylglutathione lyase family enzyme